MIEIERLNTESFSSYSDQTEMRYVEWQSQNVLVKHVL